MNRREMAQQKKRNPHQQERSELHNIFHFTRHNAHLLISFIITHYSPPVNETVVWELLQRSFSAPASVGSQPRCHWHLLTHSL